MNSRRSRVVFSVTSAFLLFSATSVVGQAIGPMTMPISAAFEEDTVAAPAILPGDLRPLGALRPAAEGAVDQLAAMRAWNRAGKPPLRNGFVRPLPRARWVKAAEFRRQQAGRHAAGEDPLVWAGRVEVAGAHRLRIHLEDVRLPPGSRLWVSGSGGETVGPLGLELAGPDGDLWTPSVSGPAATVTVRLSASGPLAPEGAFRIGEVAEILAAPDGVEDVPAPSHVQSCLVDGGCVTTATLDGVDRYRAAVAHLQFMIDGASYVCTGGLLNDTDDSTVIPYLLTANHCIRSQATASSLEAFWDYFTPRCGGAFPDLETVPRSNGGTLLATSLQTDFALVRLSSVPGGRVLLGWNADPSAIGEGTLLHRLSHPSPDALPYPQTYSRTRAAAAPLSTCTRDFDGRPWNDLTKFVYSSAERGAVFLGSSGAPAVLPGGVVVGQLLGLCGQNAAEPCLFGPYDHVVDGRFSATFPEIARWLDPAAGSGPCVPDASTACLADGRFEVAVDWRTASGSGAAQVMTFGGQRAENGDSAFFWFFSSTNFELGLKILDACGVNDRFWVFISGLTDQGWTVRIRDTQTGGTKTYGNPPGRLTPTTADTSAFPCR